MVGENEERGKRWKSAANRGIGESRLRGISPITFKNGDPVIREIPGVSDLL